jgi:hypothetical protein
MVKGYCGHFGIKLDEAELEREALEWSTTRGSRSGRVAWQFTQELAGRLGVKLTTPPVSGDAVSKEGIAQRKPGQRRINVPKH